MNGRAAVVIALVVLVVAGLSGCSVDAPDTGIVPRTAGQDEGVDPPKVDPQQALKLTVEPPAQPVPLRGPISLKVWMENTCDRPLVICRRLDGSGPIPWPTYEVHLTDPAGQEVPHKSYRDCGTRFR